MSRNYYEFDRFTPCEVFDWIKTSSGTKTMVVDDIRIGDITSTRMLTYYKRGCKCLACGRVGTEFVAETHMTDPLLLKWFFNPLDNPTPPVHLNLYGYDPDGTRFMITSDHVVPKSLGGSNSVKNRVPLCEDCNQLKGNDAAWLTDRPKNDKGRLIHRKSHQVRTGAKKESVNA